MHQALHSPKAAATPPAHSRLPARRHEQPMTAPAKGLTLSLSAIPQASPAPLASSGGVIQEKSTVVNRSQSYSWNGKSTAVGLSMKAWLDPDYPVQGEEANLNTAQTPMMRAIKEKYHDSLTKDCHLVKGHLLNANLGGKALNNNLFPITKTANGEHLRTAENTIKNKVWKDRQPTYYSVTVDGNPNIDNEEYSFDVTWGDWDMDSEGGISNQKYISIPSDFSDLKTNGGAARVKAKMTNKKSSGSGLSLAPYETVGAMDKKSKDRRNDFADRDEMHTKHGADEDGQYCSELKDDEDDISDAFYDEEEESNDLDDREDAELDEDDDIPMQ